MVLLLTACGAVPPKLDPATLGTVPPEDKFVVTVDDTSVTVDHLRVGPDSIWARRAPTDGTDAPSDLAFRRGSVTDLRRAYTGSPGVEFLVLPVALMVAAMMVFRAGFGSD